MANSVLIEPGIKPGTALAALQEQIDALAPGNVELRRAFEAVVAEQARLREAQERRAARIATINRVGRLITSSLRLADLFQNAVEAISEHLGYAYVAAGTVVPDDPEMLMLLAHTGAHAARVPDNYRQSIYEGLIGAAARSRRRVLVNNVASDERYIALIGDPVICAELAVPIVANGQLLGVLNIESDRPIDEEEADDIEIVADQLGVALENARLFNRIEQALETTRLLYATSQRISTAMSVDDVVAAYLQQVASRGSYNCTVATYEFDDNGRRTMVTVLGSWSAQTGLSLERRQFPYTRDALDPPLDAGETVAIPDVHSDPRVSEELREIQRRDGRPALALIPLIVGQWRIGLVILSAPQVHDWSEANLHSYQVTAAQLATAIESRRQHITLAERERRLAVLEERRRLARDLHDSVTQSMFSMSLLAQVLPDLWQVDQDEARAGLEQMRDLTRGALAEMRALLFELRPAPLGSQSLARALQEHALVFEQRTGVSVTVEAPETGPIPPRVEEALFRIAQESLANVARHARARRVRVTLSGGSPLRLRISDDGQGFATDRVAEGGMGLNSMRERAAMIGAQLTVLSSPGQGTEISLEWPAAPTTT